MYQSISQLSAILANLAISQQPLLTSLAQRTGVVRSGLQTQFATQLKELPLKLKTQQFWYVVTPDNQSKEPWLLDSTTGLLWNPVSKDEEFATAYSYTTATTKCSTLRAVQSTAWDLPIDGVLLNFAKNGNNPWKNNGAHPFGQNAWGMKNSTNGVDLNDGRYDRSSFFLIATNPRFANDLIAFVAFAAQNNWQVFAPNDKERSNLLKPLIKLIYATDGDALIPILKTIDQHSANLPLLENADFTDPHKGIWELHGMDAELLKKAGIRARNPADDVQDGMVAIDFGTSSTVVAYEEDGVGKLLRIGVSDFWEKEKPAHYENPTILELVDFPAMLTAWQKDTYRPAVKWGDVRCSHEALHNFRNNQTDTKVVGSVLTKIKQWALREGDGTRVRITDQTTHTEHELAALTECNPVKGQAMKVTASYPWDPVEMYAWFLGLTINKRPKIFLRYYMTFPVDYPREVKDKVLSSFRRGLQRSLPATLVQSPAVFEKFAVEERASEPAAYAAVALPALGIEPTSPGTPYAVFDFGGGTADFDFGYYRLPTEAEERMGIEQVLEHFGSGGDKFLGGENLLEHMAYHTFRHNLEVCRTHKVAFTKPLDAKPFNGSEMFLERTQAATTNTLMLITQLRPFLEQGDAGKIKDDSGILKIEMINREGTKAKCELIIPYDELAALLQNRIQEGVQNFFTTLKKAFGDELPEEVQVLLAGNASRSETVLGLFGLLLEEHPQSALEEKTFTFLDKLFPEGDAPEFTSHAPLIADDSDVNRPTAKTGVALGLLELCPGSATKEVNHAVKNATGDAPFQHFVGRIRQKKFHPALHQGGKYGQWVELGPVGEDRLFKLFHTQAARALAGTMPLGDPALLMKTLAFAGDVAGKQVCARPIKPHEIEICTATSAEEATFAGQKVSNLQTVVLG